MDTGPTGTVLRYIYRLRVADQTRDLGDAQLLRRFAAQQEEEVFAALVQRHGRLVWAVCRHVLRHEQDAEDAFQATFLVLARKGATIRKGEALASWLQGTAYRVALRAKRDLAIRRAHERRGQRRPAEESLPESVLREALALLDEEVGRLPVKQRTVFVLCCLEGTSLAAAARQLGWKQGTVSGTLARARQRLRQRLTRRGVTLTALLTAAALDPCAGRAALPAGLARATVRTALGFLVGEPALAPATSPVAALAEGVLRGMALARAATATAMLLAMSLLALGTGLLACQSREGQPSETRPSETSEAARVQPVEDGPKPSRVDQFGDPLPPGAVARLGTVRFRHGDRIYSVAVSPDGKVLASRGLDGAVRLWDMTSGRELACWRLPAAGYWTDTVAFSRDGQHLAAATASGTSPGSAVVVWEVATRRQVHRIEVRDGRVSAVAFLGDGNRLAGVADTSIRVWDTASGRELRRLKGHKDEIEIITVSSDGHTLASGSRDKTVRLWNPATGAEVRRLQGQLTLAPDVELALGATAKQRGVLSMAFTPDGTMLAVMAGGERTIRLWNTATGLELPPFAGESHQVTALAFLRDGKALASGGWDGMIRLWDVAGRKEIRCFQGQQSPILSLALSPDGKALAVGGYRTVRLWDLGGGRELRPLPGHHQEVGQLAFAPDGRTVASASGGGDSTVCLWEAATGRELRRWAAPAGGVGVLTFSPDGKALVAGKGALLLCEATTGREVLRAESPTSSAVALSPDGRLRCDHPDREGIMVLSDVRTGARVRRFQGYARSLSSAAFSADGKYLATAFHSEPRAVIIWEVATGGKVSECRGADDHSTFMTLAFTPDGKTLASGGWDGTVRLWEVVTGGERRRFRGHLSGITTLAFSPDGSRLVSGGSDTLGMVWDVRGRAADEPGLAVDLSSREFEALWADLAAADAARAYRASRRLAGGPTGTVTLLAERLRPAPAASRERLTRLIADLDSGRFPVRQRAAQELAELGEVAEPALRRALDGGPSLEVRRRVEGLLQKLRLIESPERLRRFRAVEALEFLATPEARRLLEGLAGGAPEATVTREARASLQRLGKLQALPP